MSDQLRAATRALRLSRNGSSPSAQATEQLVLARVVRQARRTRRMQWLLPIAAVLAVSSGWAATQPQVRREAEAWWVKLTTAARSPAKPSSPRTSPTATAAVLTEATAPPTSLPSLEPHGASAPINQPTSSNGGPLRKPEASSLPRPAVAPEPARASEVAPAPAPGPPTPLQLYQRAHELHFRKQDWGAALAAWDSYLANSVAGPLVLEARYNRAICLSRLGRTAEARAALLPFARGDYGGYRQAEAKVLLNDGNAVEP